MINADGDEEVWLVEVPTDVFADSMMDSTILRVVSVTEDNVTILFETLEAAQDFERIYYLYEQYNLVTFFRCSEPMKSWDDEAIAYRYGFQLSKVR